MVASTLKLWPQKTILYALFSNFFEGDVNKRRTKWLFHPRNKTK